MRRARTALLALGGVAALAVAGCGSDDHPNEPRPPAPVELTAKVDRGKVVVSPSEVGAGLANITISNQTDEDVQLSFVGPTEATTDPIVDGGVIDFKIDLEQGDYEVGTESSGQRTAQLDVGPERPSSQNDLLLP